MSRSVRLSVSFCSLAAFCLALGHLTVGAEIVLVSGETRAGEVASISEGEVRMADGTRKALEQVRSIRFAEEGASSTGEVGAVDETLFLACGSVLRGKGARLDENEDVRFEIDGRIPAAFVIDAVKGVRLGAARGGSLFERSLAGELRGDRDRVYLLQEAEVREVEGTLEAFGAEKVSIDRGGGAVLELGRAKVHGILFAQTLEPDVAGLNAAVRTAGGSVLKGRVASLEEGVLKLAMLEKAEVSLPVAALVAVRIVPANLVFASDLEPAAALVQPVLAPAREWRRDLAVTGEALRLGRQTFEKGLGMAGGTRLEFANPEKYSKFTALVGIDLERGARGDCEAVVLGDGRELARQRLKGGEPPVALAVDVSEAAQVTLYVDPGADYDLSDHVNWGDAAFLTP